MTLRRLVAALAAVASTAASTAGAALVQTTVLSSTGTTATMVHDTESSLLWLSPRATTGLTISAVTAGAGGWTTDGFRYATIAELLALLHHAGIPALGIDTGWSETWSDAATVAAMQELVSGLGWTYENNAPGPGSPFGQRELYGVLADAYLGDGQSPASRRFAWFGASDSLAYAYAVGGQWLHQSADPMVGSFLVREVPAAIPEPGMLALVLPGLVLVLGHGRRR